MPDPTPSPQAPSIDLTRRRHVHIVGIGGAGMSAIATVLAAMGHHVSGSDAVDSPTLRRLAAGGMSVHVTHDAAWIGDAEVVAVSTAIPGDNVEVTEAARRGLRVWRRSDMLRAICAGTRTIAVAGTHGKTSTSSMLALILSEAGLHPSYIIGGEIVGVGPGAVWDPDGEWFVVEADESDGTFLELGAEAVIVTSVEPDHLDYYGDETAMRDAFARFARAATGPRVICADDAGAVSLVAATRTSAGRAGTAGTGAPITYGTSPSATARIEEVTLGRAAARFSVRHLGELHGPFDVAMPGLLYVRNAVAALTMAQALGVPWAQAGSILAHYRGVARRFESRGDRNGVTFIDDYGHLPTEVAATLGAASAGGWTRVVAVFQPHRFSRTASLWRDFADAFTGADVLLVTDIYSAGEPARAGVNGRLIVHAVLDAHPLADVRYVPTLADAELELARILRPGDLCLTLGAGDLTTLPDRFLGSRGEADG